jgi:hypothetical protein
MSIPLPVDASFSLYCDKLLSPQIQKLEDHSLSVLRDCYFNLSMAIIHIWGPSLEGIPYGNKGLNWISSYQTVAGTVVCAESEK